MSEPTREHVEAVARSIRPDLFREPSPEYVSLSQARAVHRMQLVEDLTDLLTSTDPAVLDALQDALVRAGRLTEQRRTLADGMGGCTVTAAGVTRHIHRAPTTQRRLVTEWTEAPDA